ncbi:penicillin-binding protein [Chlorobaculum limnaeum]|uniref:Penicillin-binding protein n=1 Tax=Chlorobaculum limnaeum TaxID=274537 RepID=A0A1D8D6J7_CHLLM|nr:PASTA domain-containing protein [Chlorobaculum limnaeum]AOS83798.1 penicillin-binding protein [Chlorobaculum limnaeum]
MKKVLILLLSIIVAIVAADKLLLPFLTESGAQTTVPDVRNMNYDTAASQLRKAGLNATKSYNVRYLPDVPPDRVIDQVPEAGAIVKPGRSIALVLNRQDKPSYPMPDLVGRTEAEALRELERLGMVVSSVQTQAVSDSDQDGRVLIQSVPPDVVLKSGNEVSFIVGKLEQEPLGMRRVIVPDVLGMSVDQARGVIVRNGLAVGKIIYEYSDLLVPDTVISQNPSANAMVQFGQPVELTVAAGSN